MPGAERLPGCGQRRRICFSIDGRASPGRDRPSRPPLSDKVYPQNVAMFDGSAEFLDGSPCHAHGSSRLFDDNNAQAIDLGMTTPMSSDTPVQQARQQQDTSTVPAPTLGSSVPSEHIAAGPPQQRRLPAAPVVGHDDAARAPTSSMNTIYRDATTSLHRQDFSEAVRLLSSLLDSRDMRPAPRAAQSAPRAMLDFYNNCVTQLVACLSYLGRHPSAIDKAMELLQHNESDLGSLHILTIRARGCLATACGEAKDLQKKIQLLDITVEDMQTVLGTDDRETLLTRAALGNAYGSARNPTKQRDILVEVLAKLKATSPAAESDLEVLRVEGNLANAYGQLKDFVRQRDMLLSVIDRKTKLNKDPNHAELARTVHNLGLAYGGTGQIPEKLQALERSLKIKRLNWAPLSPELTVTLKALAVTHRDLARGIEGGPAPAPDALAQQRTKQLEYLREAAEILRMQSAPPEEIRKMEEEIASVTSMQRPTGGSMANLGMAAMPGTTTPHRALGTPVAPLTVVAVVDTWKLADKADRAVEHLLTAWTIDSGYVTGDDDMDHYLQAEIHQARFDVGWSPPPASSVEFPLPVTELSELPGLQPNCTARWLSNHIKDYRLGASDARSRPMQTPEWKFAEAAIRYAKQLRRAGFPFAGHLVTDGILQRWNTLSQQWNGSNSVGDHGTFRLKYGVAVHHITMRIVSEMVMNLIDMKRIAPPPTEVSVALEPGTTSLLKEKVFALKRILSDAADEDSQAPCFEMAYTTLSAAARALRDRQGYLESRRGLLQLCTRREDLTEGIILKGKTAPRRRGPYY